MNSARANPDLTGCLYPDETVLWTGPAAFPPASHAIPVLLCLALVVVVFRATWLADLNAECIGAVSCVIFLWSVPLLLLLFMGSLLFDVLERLLVSCGRARVWLILTDQRFIRLADWPWRRVRAADYRVSPLYRVRPGLLRQGRYLTFALSPGDAETILDSIARQRTKAD